MAWFGPQVMVSLAAQSIGPLLGALGALIVILIASALAWKWWRDRMLKQDRDADTQTPLEHLRKLRDTGELTTEEYDAARARVMEKLRGSVEVPEAVRQMRERRTDPAQKGYPQPDSPPEPSAKVTKPRNGADGGPTRR